MLTYSFDNLQGESMYAHLYRCIKEDILAGTLTANTKLPSKRTLAKNLGISSITVENAYAQLVVEGYIYSMPKRGYFVAELEQKAPLQRSKNKPTPDKVHLPPSQADMVNLARGGVPTEQFPYAVWARLVRNTLTNASEEDLLSDTTAGGVQQLRKAIASHLYEFRGMQVQPQQIIIGAGSQMFYSMLVQLLGRDKVYALEDPCYPQMVSVYQHNNVACLHIPLDSKGLRSDLLEASNASILHISPSHQFPTGIVMPVSRRYELLHWAAQSEERYIIEDDYDCEFRLSGKPIPSLQSMDTYEKVIYINTFSRTLSPTFRISYMILPPHLAELFYQKLGFYAGTVSNLEQLTLARFIEEGHFERHINRMRTFYRTKRDELLDYLANTPAAPYLKTEGENSGLHFLIHLKTTASDAFLTQLAEDHQVGVRFLSSFYQNAKQLKSMPKKAQHTLFINYAGIADDKLYPALDRLFSAWLPYLK